jgi:hypothetical protein
MYKEKWSLWVHYDKRRAKRAKPRPLYRVKRFNLSGLIFSIVGDGYDVCGLALCALWVGHCNFMADRECWRYVSPGGSEQSPVAKAKTSFKQLLTAHLVLPKSSQVESQRRNLVVNILDPSQ